MSSTGLRFRTPADVRSIDNAQWEMWLRSGTLPFRSFAATRHTQMVLRHVVKATARRVGASFDR